MESPAGPGEGTDIILGLSGEIFRRIVEGEKTFSKKVFDFSTNGLLKSGKYWMKWQSAFLDPFAKERKIDSPLLFFMDGV